MSRTKEEINQIIETIMKICSICQKPESEHHHPVYIDDMRPHLIIKDVEDYFDLPNGALKGLTRSEHVAIPRMMAMEMIWKHCNMRQKDVVKYLNRRDHGSVTHARNRVLALRQTDKAFARAYRNIEANLNL